MDTEDYWSIDSILADNQVSILTLVLPIRIEADDLLTRPSLVLFFRNCPLPSLSMSRTSAISMAQEIQTCISLHFPSIYILSTPANRRSSLLRSLSSPLQIKAMTKLELPYWIAHTLAINEFVTFNIPPPYANRVRNALNAEARSVRLGGLVGSLGGWYGFGRRLVGVWVMLLHHSRLPREAKEVAGNNRV
jgi:hypothetical protein